MHHTRRFRFLIATIAVALLLAACGGTEKAATSSSSSGSGAAKQLVPVPGFDGTTINVGDLVPLTGLPAIIGKPLAAGQKAYWDYLNAEKGGIAGKYKVNVLLEDTLYETNTTVQKYNKIKNDVVMFSQVMGTPHNLALLPLLKDDNIVVAPASQDALWVREQQLFPIIEPYQIDVINGMDYWLRNGGTTSDKVCIVLENDVYGEAGLEGLKYAADKDGFSIATETRFKIGDTDFTAQINDLQGGGCQVVWAVALPSEFGAMLSTAAQRGFAPQWIAQSPAWVDEVGTGPLKDYLEQHVWVAATGPEPEDTSVPGVADLLAQRQKYAPDQKADYYFNFGYFQALAEDQLLSAAVARGDLSRTGIIDAMNGLDKLRFNGLMGDYGYGPPDQRNPSRQSSVFKINMAKPFGLQGLQINFASDAAKSFEFPAAR